MSDYESIEYKDFTIEIYSDQYMGNPLTEFDPMGVFIAADRREHAHLDTGSIADFGLADSPDYYWKRGLLRERQDYDDPYQEIEDEDVAEHIRKHYGAAVYEFSSRGYSQGDYVAGWFIVDRETLKKEYGTTKDGKLHPTARKRAMSYLKAQADEFGAWLWGDVFGYTIRDPEGEDAGYGCGGFYGSYQSENWKYMVEQAKEEVDGLIEEREAMEEEIRSMAMTELGHLAAD